MKGANRSACAGSAEQTSRSSCCCNGRGGNKGYTTGSSCGDDCRGNRIFLYRLLHCLSRISNALYDRVTSRKHGAQPRI